MNRKELIDSIMERSGVERKQTELVIKCFEDIIAETLQNGERVQLLGFGVFEARDRIDRIGKHPQTREDILIPASKLPYFKAGKGLKNAVNK